MLELCVCERRAGGKQTLGKMRQVAPSPERPNTSGGWQEEEGLAELGSPAGPGEGCALVHLF